MELAEYEELMFKAAVIRHVGAKLGIADSAMLSGNELLPLIQDRSGEAAEALTAFLTVHQMWSDFHLKIERENRAGHLAASEHAQLMSLIERRDRARQVLLSLLDAPSLA